MQIGVLAIQGAVSAHLTKLEQLGVASKEVRTPAQLEGLSGIILPGGESSTMVRLLKLADLWNPLKHFLTERPALGVCAGMILLAKKVSHPEQDCLGALDITVERNGYGRQLDSFADILTPVSKSAVAIEGVFIRAPRITNLGPQVTTLFSHRDEPVMVEQQNLLAASFHPELTDNTYIHQYFIEKCHE